MGQGEQHRTYEHIKYCWIWVLLYLICLICKRDWLCNPCQWHMPIYFMVCRPVLRYNMFARCLCFLWICPILKVRTSYIHKFNIRRFFFLYIILKMLFLLFSCRTLYGFGLFMSFYYFLLFQWFYYSRKIDIGVVNILMFALQCYAYSRNV